MTNDKDKKIRKLNAIFNDYVRKDIASLFTIDYLSDFTKLVKILSERMSNLLVVSNLSSECNLNYRTIKKYLDILELIFIVQILLPYSKRIKKRLIKSPKIFFFDNGLRNHALQNFLPLENRTDKGQLVENNIFNCLKNIGREAFLNELSFWRTSGGSEVDFICNDIAIEVKSGSFINNPPRALFECMEALKLKRAIIFNKTRFEKIKISEKEIVFAPYILWSPL